MNPKYLNDDAREYLESDDGGYYEVTIPFIWNDRPKPNAPPYLWVDVVFPESFREAYSDELQSSDAHDDHIIEEETSRRLDTWLTTGRVYGVGGADGLDSVPKLRAALEYDAITLLL